MRNEYFRNHYKKNRDRILERKREYNKEYNKRPEVKVRNRKYQRKYQEENPRAKWARLKKMNPYKKPICIRTVNENLRRVKLGMELTVPLRRLNTHCEFKKKYREWCIINEGITDEKKEANHKYYRKNKEKKKEYYRKNKEKHKILMKKWREKNPNYKKEYYERKKNAKININK